MEYDLEPAWPNAGAAMDLIRQHGDVVNFYGTPAEFFESFARLPTYIGHLFAVFWCDAEVCNGGLHQFFGNSTGMLAPEASAGFRAIGLHDRGSIVDEAIALFGPDYPRDCEERGERLAKLERSGRTRREWDPFYTLDSRYYALCDSFWEIMDRYAATGGDAR